MRAVSFRSRTAEHARLSLRRRLQAAALFMLVAGCTSSRLSDAHHERLLAQIRAHGVEPNAIVLPFEPDEEMRAWVRETVQTGGDPERRLQQLLHAILHRNKTQLTYQRGVTYTAREVWRTNRANCLSFTHLYVGLAREIGLPVYYLRVSDFERYEKDGDLVIASDHVTAAYGPTTQRRVLDFTERPFAEYHVSEPISDLTAIALHYSNVGAEQIREARFADAEASLRIAVRIDPELADGWVNLGVAVRRLGRTHDAEASFRRALEVNPGALSAYHNLATLLDLQGRGNESRKLLELTDRRRNRNPFSYLALGDLALSEGRLTEAERFFRRARRLHPAHAEPLAALGQWAFAAGRLRDAERWLEKSKKIDPNDPRAADLARALRRALARWSRKTSQ